jgi:hypothetical protein
MALLLLLLPSPSLMPTAPTTWVNSTAGVHTFLTFDSSWLATELKADPTDPRAKHLDFVWGADEWALAPIRAANPETRTSKYIPCCRDTQLPVFGAAAIANYTQRGWGSRILYTCDKKTPAYYSHGSAGRASHRSLPLDFSNPDVIEWQAEQAAKPAAALGYDVLALDNTEIENGWNACGVWRTPTEWVQLYNGSVIDPAFETAVGDWLGALKAKVNAITTKRGKPMAIIPNFSLHLMKWNDSAIWRVGNNTDGILTESGFIGGGYRGPGDPYDYIGDAWVQRILFARNLQREGKAYYSINAYGDHSGGSKTENKSCVSDPHACISKAVRQWVLGSYLIEKEQASGIALYQLLAPIGSGSGYGNWSFLTPEWTADVGVALAPPEVSAAGLWSRRFSKALVLVNPWPDRGSLEGMVPMVPAVVKWQEWQDVYGVAVPQGKIQIAAVTATTLLLLTKNIVVKSDDETRGLPPRFHIGAAGGPAYDAAHWAKQVPDGQPIATPEMWARMGEAYKLYAKAGFTILDGGPPLPVSGVGQPGPGPCGPGCYNNKTTVELQIQATFLKLCADAGLEVMNSFYWEGGKITPMEEKVVWGYGLADEPGPNLYPEMVNKSKHVQEFRPNTKAFINLAPLYSCTQPCAKETPCWENSTAAWPVPVPDVCDCVEQYIAYVDQFVEQVLPSMPRGSPLSFDHYPAFDVPDNAQADNWTLSNAGSTRTGYRANLAIIRAAALRSNTTFWKCVTCYWPCLDCCSLMSLACCSYFVTMPVGGPDPSEGRE